MISTWPPTRAAGIRLLQNIFPVPSLTAWRHSIDVHFRWQRSYPERTEFAVTGNGGLTTEPIEFVIYREMNTRFIRYFLKAQKISEQVLTIADWAIGVGGTKSK